MKPFVGRGVARLAGDQVLLMNTDTGSDLLFVVGRISTRQEPEMRQALDERTIEGDAVLLKTAFAVRMALPPGPYTIGEEVEVDLRAAGTAIRGTRGQWKAIGVWVALIVLFLAVYTLFHAR